MQKLLNEGLSGIKHFQIAYIIAFKVKGINILHNRFSSSFLSPPKAFHFCISKHSNVKLCGRSQAIHHCGKC